MRIRRSGAMVLVALLVCVSCTQQTPKAPQASETAKLSRDGLWERRRQCSAAIDDVLKHTGWAKPVPAYFNVLNASSHYNEADERCYVRIDLLNNQANVKAGVPLSSYVVFDAFDAGTSVSCSDDLSAARGMCSVSLPGKGDVSDCDHCRAVTKDLMTK
jgi:hypothetical protein